MAAGWSAATLCLDPELPIGQARVDVGRWEKQDWARATKRPVGH
jgi:hypothetical protein